jgi:hypothetical protein
MDLTGADAESVLRRPNIFFGPEPETPNERIFELIEELAFMFQRPASQTCALREFVDCLPYGARIFQIGFMLSRPDDVGMRLCVDKTETEPEKILDWLVKLRPAMNVTEAELLRRALEGVFPLCRDINFGFNLTKGGVDEALGVECYEDWINEDTAQWRPLLDEITRAQLCLPEKAQGVRDYAGITASQSHKRIDCGIIFLNTYRKIHHLKLTLSQGTLIQAKAYLSVSRPGLPLSLFGFPTAAYDAGQKAGQAWKIQ